MDIAEELASLAHMFCMHAANTELAAVLQVFKELAPGVGSPRFILSEITISLLRQAGINAVPAEPFGITLMYKGTPIQIVEGKGQVLLED